MELTQSLHRASQINPDGLAIVFGPVRRSWRQFHDAVARSAGMLRQLGVRADTKVAIVSMNSDHFVECLYAVPWAGGVLVPVNFRLQFEELAYVVEHSEAELVLFEEQFCGLVGELLKRIPRLRHAVVMDAEKSVLPGALSYSRAVADAAPLPDEAARR